MATQEKLLKSLEILKKLLNKSYTSDTFKNKDKIQHIHTITEAITNPTIKIAQNFTQLLSLTIETLLNLCDDPESHVRMSSEECLNRIIRSMNNENIGKVQIELHKEIKRNGAQRSLRVALNRFSQLVHYIRPHQGRAYVESLRPTIIKVSERTEEQVHETLAGSLPRIMKFLGCFISENELKTLIKAFLKNISNESPTIRRSTATCILCISLNCRKPFIFVDYVLTCLLDLIIPVNENQNNYLILGILTNFKLFMPNIEKLMDEHLSNSEITENQEEHSIFSLDKILQIYELCLYNLLHTDHNVVNAALETLNVFLQNISLEIKRCLLDKNGIEKNRIFVSHSLRSASQLSVATNATLIEDIIESELTETIRSDIEKWIDDSKLSVINLTCSKGIEQSLQLASIQDNFNEKVLEEYTIRSQSICENLEQLTVSRNSSEKSFSYIEDNKNDILDKQETNIGTYLDKDIPLIYCARLIVKSFLLSGHSNVYIPDRTIRVSVKCLALSCLSSIIIIYPKILLLYVDKLENDQKISDILLFADHPDPQLRGLTRILIGNFINSVLIESIGDYNCWLNTFENEFTELNIENLIDLIIKGFNDKSTNCTRQSIQSLSIFLNLLVKSKCCTKIKPILYSLPLLATNSYWLIKVSLCELLSNLPYLNFYDIIETSNFQKKILFSVLFGFLDCDDVRVRNASASAIVKIVPFLYCEDYDVKENPTIAKAVSYKEIYLSSLYEQQNSSNNNLKQIISNMPFPLNHINQKKNNKISFSLSKIVLKLFNLSIKSSSKYFTSGCIQTLASLSNIYTPVVYYDSWGCKNSLNTSDLFNYCITLLRYSTEIYDLNFHSNVLNLCTNLYSGFSLSCLKPDIEKNETLWHMFNNEHLKKLSEQYLNHLMKLLNIFYHVIEEIQPQTKVGITNLSAASSTLSPIKRQKSDLDKKLLNPISKTMENQEKSEKLLGTFSHLSHYMMIYKNLRSSYTNYKTSLDTEACEYFIKLLEKTLQAFSIFMEIGCLVEFSRISCEILTYFRSIFDLAPEITVECVKQLLKCLFGTNLTAHLTDIIPENFRKNYTEIDNVNGFYYKAFQKIYNNLSSTIISLKSLITNKMNCDNCDNTVMGYLHRKNSKKPSVLVRTSDKILANYIKIFEPMVIKSLKNYTMTSNVKLQCKVLELLYQLIQLRVNYCLLDSDQIFIGFVLKQFEYIEEGQINHCYELVPKIFQFLVQLSYSKQHSKSIISIPKIIQLCDGLLASGQSPLDNCIPALEPIVEDIFLCRNKPNTNDFKELETTRDVILAMLLKLSEYYQVLDLIILILEDSKYYSDNSEKWFKWSQQVITNIVLILKQNKMIINESKALITLKKLIFTLNPNVFKSIDDIILLIFQNPINLNSSLNVYNCWLAKILISFLILSSFNEDHLLMKISELKFNFNVECLLNNCPIIIDPLNVLNNISHLGQLSSEIIFVQLIFKILTLTSRKCIEIVRNSIKDNANFFIEELSIFLMHCIYIFESGNHSKIINVTIEKKNEMNLNEINKNFLDVEIFFPLLVSKWFYLLTLIDYNDKNYWSNIIGNNCDLSTFKHLPINKKITKTASIILFCNYMTENIFSFESLSWLLSNNIILLIYLYDEAPINEFIAYLHRDPTTSKLLLNNIANNCLEIEDACFQMKILKSIEGTNLLYLGDLLKLVLPKFLLTRQLAVSRLVANLASRKIEILLTLSMEDVNNQLAKEDLFEIIKFMISYNLVKKHEALSSLLNKLCMQYYDASPIEFDQKRTINPEYINKLQINKAWYLSQINDKEKDTIELLNKLDCQSLMNLMTKNNFNKAVLKDCIKFGINVIKRQFIIKSEPPPSIIIASVDYLFKEIKKICNFFPTNQKNIYNELNEQFFQSKIINDLSYLIPAISYFIRSINCLPTSVTINEENYENFLKFGIICLELIIHCINTDENNLNINLIDNALNCTDLILKQSYLCNILTHEDYLLWLWSLVDNLYKLVDYLLIDGEPLFIMENYLKINGSAGEICLKLNILVEWLSKINNLTINIPNFFFKSIENIIISLSRLPIVYSYILIPEKVWKSGWYPELFGKFNTQVPPLPLYYLQEINILKEFIHRITLLGWLTRQQFEENWMSLLSVLCNSPNENSHSDDINDLIYASSLSVQAITTLLLQSLLIEPGNRINSKFLHISRNLPINDYNLSIKKLRLIQNNIENEFNASKHFSHILNVFNNENFEKISDDFNYNQISVKYLMIACGIIEISDNCIISKIFIERQNILNNNGLDINSCLLFLVDFYSQILNTQIQLKFLHEIVRSIVCISDLFNDKNQFEWMLNLFLDLIKIHGSEDELLHQYLIVGICKSAAILTPDLEIYENIKKLLNQYLKSTFLPSRIASLHGLLYILEGCKLSNISIGRVSDEMQIILPCAVEYIQCHFKSNENFKLSLKHTMLVWSLSFYLIENIEENCMEADFVMNTLENLFSILQQNPSIVLLNALMKGLERLIIVHRPIGEKIANQTLNVALEKMRNDNPRISILGNQLLLSYMYTDCWKHFENHNSETNPEYLVQISEKFSAIFNHIKHGYLFEIEILCTVLPDILNDFFSPSDVLTKVISEFLSPHQPHPKLLSRVVFKIFEQAIQQNQLSLLQDWVIFSLSNFIQSLSIGMATWCLTCFFISASTNEWLRAFFPYVQTRVGRYEYEDRKMLCIAGSDFYKNLLDDKQKQTFIDNFNKVKNQTDTLFNDLLNSL